MSPSFHVHIMAWT